MTTARKETAINNISNAFKSYNSIIQEYKTHNRTTIAVWGRETVSQELTASFNILYLKIPSFIKTAKDKKEYWSGTADAYIKSEADIFKPEHAPSIPVYNFKIPAGYGEDAAVALHNETSNMLQVVFNRDLKNINIETLKEKTEIYENLRRTVRGICALRNSSPSLLTQAELALIFETALIFPPETALEYITPLFSFCKDNSGPEGKSLPGAMIFSCDSFCGETADLIEKEGILITEDDTPGGRRSFDLSLDYKSDYIFYELLDAFSYRPYAPSLRSPEERYELLYKLLRNYGIELVIFIESPGLPFSKEIINYLRIKCMRNGVDVIVTSAEKSPQLVRNYLINAR